MKKKTKKKSPPKIEPVNMFAIKPPCPVCGCSYLIAREFEISLKKIVVRGECMWCGWASEKWNKKIPKKLVRTHSII